MIIRISFSIKDDSFQINGQIVMS